MGLDQKQRNLLKQMIIIFFSDDNDNGILDENEYILSPAEAQYEYSVSYAKVADSFKLTLTEGFNLVAFPIIFTDANDKEISKASDLIDFLNKRRGTDNINLCI